MKRQRFRILVTWKDGEEEYLKQGSRDAIFLSRRAASEQVEFMKFGMDDYESIEIEAVTDGGAP